MKDQIFIADTKYNPVLAGAWKRMQDLTKETKERSAFIAKQAENLSQEVKARKTDLWKEIEAELLAKGLIEQKHTDAKLFGLHLNDHGQVFLYERGPQEDFPELLRRLLGQ